MIFIHKPDSVIDTTRVFCLALLLILACPESSRGQSGAVYIYDELGRLVGVVDPSSETARYVYDATGNIVSVSRYRSTQVSIIQFTPNSGPTSTTVKIYGTGFSGTSTQDKVKFNGVEATIVSASSTEIVTTVPVGASTGLITVATPTGSTSSTQPFIIGLAKSPTVTGFTPRIGSPGTAVNIAGTNFQTTPTTNAARFNVTLSQVASATALNIKTSVPVGATSGRVSVTTPYGKATSTADFFAPPPPYGTSDVVFTGRMSLGQSSTLTIDKAQKIGLMVFDEMSDHRMSLVARNVTFALCGTLFILSPSGVVLASNNSICKGITGFLDTRTLSEDGTYTILAQASGSTGSVAITLYDVAHDFTSSITPDGPPVVVKLTIPGQNAELTFSGISGEHVSLNLANGTFPFCSPNVSIIKPDGTILFSATCFGPGGFIPAQTLPSTGTYTFLLTMADAGTGSITANLYNVTNVTGAIAINGSPVTVSLKTPGQVAALTFKATANEKATVHVTNSTITCVTLGIVKPNGTSLISELECGGSFDLPTQTLPATGTYTLSIVPNQADTGSLTVRIASP